ncbi:MAG: hypothetical protein ACFFD1_04965, partial [Candidatus Thorarchaeota archaeon]
YLSNKINEATFCYEFYCSFDLELDYDTLEEDEYKAFDELSEITCRFSEFEKDIKSYPGVYRTKEEVKNKIISTKERLSKYFNEFKHPGKNQEDINA